jgi:VanZ family protein
VLFVRTVLEIRPILKYWLPVLLWMAVIFMGSTDILSYSNTERFLVPFLRWLYRGISDFGLRQTMVFIRKMGHITEYAVLFILVWRALNHWTLRTHALGFWSNAGPALVFAALYAVTDEFHQSFYRSRTASIGDVLIDVGGAGLGLLLLWGLGSRLRSAASITLQPATSKKPAAPSLCP